MAYKFADNWADEIAEVTESEEYQTATVRIKDPSLAVTPAGYNEATATWTPSTGSQVIYEGRARIIGVRWGVFSGGESQANSTTLKSVRVQVPFSELPERVKRGCLVYIASSPDNLALEGLILKVTSDFQGSSAASRTFECGMDQDVSGT